MNGFGGYQVSNETYHFGVGADYTIENIGKIAGSIHFAGASELNDISLNLSLTNDTLISGAKLKLEYDGGNYMADEIGAITASCTMEF